MILIISEEKEKNVDRIESILKRRRAPYLRFNTEDFPMSSFLNLRPGEESSLRTLQGTVRLTDIQTVWLRRRGRHRLAPGLTSDEEKIVRDTCKTALKGLWSFLECFWVNDPSREEVAENKPFQLKLAHELGLKVPRTRITNDPDEVRHFFAQCHEQVAFKPLEDAFLAEAKKDPNAPGQMTYQGVYTNLLKEEHLDRLSGLQSAPMIFQEYVPKKFELRITIVGHQLFAAEIHSQDSPQEKTRIDWRHYDIEHTPHRPHALPGEIQEKLLHFMKATGLVFGCVDMIVTPGGDYVFLENNPGGQWGWIERLTELPISEALADLLIRGRSEK